MFIRKRLTYANVAATLALVFAMTGGAFAASHYIITSTKQISPKVVKHLKGKRGKRGKTGATGATGPQGVPGPEGKAGPKGTQGPEGKAGAPGATSVLTRYGPETTATSGNLAGSYAACESGESVTGGGFNLTATPANTNLSTEADRPSVITYIKIGPITLPLYVAPAEGTAATGWYASIRNATGSEVKIRAYVICASP